MKKSLLTILLFLPLFQYAQVDVFGGGSITLGIKSNHVSYSGFYGRTLNNGNSPGAILPNQDLELITDQGSALNIDFHYYKTVLFFGKGLGGTLGFKYEVVKGYSERQYTGDKILKNPVSLNQFEI